LVNKVED